MTPAHRREHPAYMVFMLVLSVLSLVGLALSLRSGLDPAVHDALLRNIDELRRLKPDKLVRKRREKYLKMGAFEE